MVPETYNVEISNRANNQLEHLSCARLLGNSVLSNDPDDLTFHSDQSSCYLQAR
jgi:hypothetical protein